MLSDLSLLCFSPQEIILTKLLIKLNCICRDLKISKLQSSYKLLREGVESPSLEIFWRFQDMV